MRPLAVFLATLLLAACTTGTGDGSGRPARPTTTTTSEPATATTQVASPDCLDAYKKHRTIQSARSAQQVLASCADEIDSEFQASLRAFAADLPSPGCKSAYREWIIHRDAEPPNRTWTTNRQYPRAAAEVLRVCDFEIDTDLQDTLRTEASRPFISEECLAAYKEWDTVMVQRTRFKGWNEKINLVERTMTACRGQLEDSLYRKIVQSRPQRTSPTPRTTTPRVSNERACDLLYADYFEAVADGNTDRQLRLYAQILREDC